MGRAVTGRRHFFSNQIEQWFEVPQCVVRASPCSPVRSPPPRSGTYLPLSSFSADEHGECLPVSTGSVRGISTPPSLNGSMVGQSGMRTRAARLWRRGSSCCSFSLLLRVAGINVPPGAVHSSTRHSSLAVGEKCSALWCSLSREQVVIRCGAAQKHVPGSSVLWPGDDECCPRSTPLCLLLPSAVLTSLQYIFPVHAARNPPMCHAAKLLQFFCSFVPKFIWLCS
ncbi:uncharacterized protein LOC119275907 isoform X3 [Triticum dicoccoides]|uniref:uncharacterized protein LOC119275907 isoform X3 n=1 Tax=Triticum dicoccoides TaxID=85692 RepID=UPI000E7CCF32|nr:uncharacterized protein LOC119275907 isoform X3 [Triticum dicoccoides]